MKRLVHWLVDLLAAVSLLAALALLPIWVSHELPQRFWLQYYSIVRDTDRDRVQIGCGLSMIDFRHIRWGELRIIGPRSDDVEVVAAFKVRFPLPKRKFAFMQCQLATGPLFGRTREGVITMDGTVEVLRTSYLTLIAVLLVLPGMRWAPPLTRWVVAKFTIKPGCCAQCGYDLRHAGPLPGMWDNPRGGVSLNAKQRSNLQILYLKFHTKTSPDIAVTCVLDCVA